MNFLIFSVSMLIVALLSKFFSKMMIGASAIMIIVYILVPTNYKNKLNSMMIVGTPIVKNAITSGKDKIKDVSEGIVKEIESN